MPPNYQPALRLVSINQSINLLKAVLFVTVRAGTAHGKIWRLVDNFFCSHNKVHCSEIPTVLSNLLHHYFFIELWHILILWLAKMPNWGMSIFTLIATGWRYRKTFFYKKAPIKSKKAKRPLVSQWNTHRLRKDAGRFYRRLTWPRVVVELSTLARRGRVLFTPSAAIHKQS